VVVLVVLDLVVVVVVVGFVDIAVVKFERFVNGNLGEVILGIDSFSARSRTFERTPVLPN